MTLGPSATRIVTLSPVPSLIFPHNERQLGCASSCGKTRVAQSLLKHFKRFTALLCVVTS